MTDKDFQLVTLGRLSLRDSSGREEESLATQRRKLALLAVLALAGRPLTRDALVGMFWGDQEEARARHSLSNALSHLRRVLGREAILPHRDDIELAPGARLRLDLTELEEAVGRGDWGRAVSLYGGPFLDGVYVDGSPTFEQWVDGHRARAETLFLKACAGRAPELAAAGAWDDLAALARRWLDAAPLSAEAMLALLDALTAPDTRDADHRALAAYERHAAMVQEEYGRRPDRAAAARARAIADRLLSGDATGEFRIPVDLLDVAAGAPEVDEDEPAPAAAAAGWRAEAAAGIVAQAPVPETIPPVPSPASPLPAAPRTRRRVGPVAAVAALVALVVVAVGWWWARRPSGEAAGPAPARATVMIAALRGSGDSATQWMSPHVSQMIAARLMRSPDLEVVAPERVREAVEGTPALSALLVAGRRVGATLLVSGGLTRTDAGLMVDLNLHDVRTGRLLDIVTVSAGDPLALADRAAVRVLQTAGAATGGLQLAEAETGSPEAFALYSQGLQEMWAGRQDRGATLLDEAIAIDSGFVSAVAERAMIAFVRQEHERLPVLLAAFERHASRATEWDRRLVALQAAFYGGEAREADERAAALTERFPRDPRAWGWRAQVAVHHGRWDEAISAVRRQLELVPLSGCVACGQGLFEFYLQMQRADSAEATARALAQAAPGSAEGPAELATLLALTGRGEEARRTIREIGVRFGPGGIGPAQVGRILLYLEDYAGADSVRRAMRLSGDPALRNSAYDLGALVARERGEWKVAAAYFDSLEQVGSDGLRAVDADTRLRLGEVGAARARLAFPAPPATRPGAGTPLAAATRTVDAVRNFCWRRAHEGELEAQLGNWPRVRQLADSLEALCGLSYYGRDWRLHHYLRGRLLAAEGRHAEAVAEFEAARWVRAGWTRVNLQLARSYRALGREEDARRVLQEALLEHLEAMGRYVPRSELRAELRLSARASRTAR